jgi:hypothetical protein
MAARAAGDGARLATGRTAWGTGLSGWHWGQVNDGEHDAGPSGAKARRVA